MFAFLRKQKLPPETKNPQPFPIGYTADEFRANAGMVSMASAFRRSMLGGHIFSALHNSVPCGSFNPDKEVHPTTAAVELGRVQGYMYCLQLLNTLCTPEPVMAEVPQDYGSEEYLKNVEGLEFK